MKFLSVAFKLSFMVVLNIEVLLLLVILAFGKRSGQGNVVTGPRWMINAFVVNGLIFLGLILAFVVYHVNLWLYDELFAE